MVKVAEACMLRPMSLELYLAYVAACVVVAVIPGPTVALIVANSLAHGSRAGMANVLGTQAGLAVMMGVLVVGLASLVETMGWWFDWLRLAGAAYLVWLGVKMLRSTGDIGRPAAAPRPRGGFFLQAFLVTATNPKMLIFFGAFIPQFVTARGDPTTQIVIFGMTAMAVAFVSDSAYALLAGSTRHFLSQARVRLATRIGGASLIGGGMWLALTRTR